MYYPAMMNEPCRRLMNEPSGEGARCIPDFVSEMDETVNQEFFKVLVSSPFLKVSYDTILAAVGENIIFHILLGLIDSEMAFAENICLYIDQLFSGFIPIFETGTEFF